MLVLTFNQSGRNYSSPRKL